MDAEGAAPGAKGTDWTAEQAAIVVANYFLMLDREWAGDKINKADLLCVPKTISGFIR